MKNIIIAALIALPAVACAQTGGEMFKITGKIGTLSEPAKVYLSYSSGGQTIIDSSVLRNGSFGFQGIAPSTPVTGSLALNKAGNGSRKTRDNIQFYIEKGTITVIGTENEIAGATISGSPTNIAYTDFKNRMKPVSDMYAAFQESQQKVTEEQRNAPQYKLDQIVTQKKMMKMNIEINKGLIKSYPDSFFSLQLLNSLITNTDPGELTALFNSLTPQIKDTKAGKKFADQLSKIQKVSIGSMAPDFALPDTAGNVIKLSSLRGKYVLIDLWASWCGPCRAENPNLKSMFGKYRNKNFTIIGVSLERPGARAQWLAAIKMDGLTWTNVSDLKFWDSEVAKSYGVSAIPQNFLLDPSGKIIGKNLRGKDLDEKLGQLFK